MKYAAQYKYQGKWITFATHDTLAAAELDRRMLTTQYDARIRETKS